MLRRVAMLVLLWAAPLAVGLGLLMLLANAPFFHTAPSAGVAGKLRAWFDPWTAALIAGAGCAIGVAANLAWLLLAWRRRHRPSAREWFRAASSLLLAVLYVWALFGP